MLYPLSYWSRQFLPFSDFITERLCRKRRRMTESGESRGDFPVAQSVQFFTTEDTEDAQIYVRVSSAKD